MKENHNLKGQIEELISKHDFGNHEFMAKLMSFNLLLDQEPPKEKVKERSVGGKLFKYLSISYYEVLLKQLFGHFTVVDFSTQVVSNEIVGTIKVKYYHPVFQEWMTTTGVAATQIRMRRLKDGETYRDHDYQFLNLKILNALEADVPHLKSDAFRNAFVNFGKLFGRDLNRDWSDTYKPYEIDSAQKMEELEAQIEELRISSQVLSKYYEKFRKYTDAKLMKQDAIKLLDQAKAEGLLESDIPHFQKRWSEEYRLLLPEIKKLS